MVLALICRFLIHFKLSFVYGVRWGSSSILLHHSKVQVVTAGLRVSEDSKKALELDPWWRMLSDGSHGLDHVGPCRSGRTLCFTLCGKEASGGLGAEK